MTDKLEEIIKKENEKISVDWEKFVELQTKNPDEYDDILIALEKENILTRGIKEAYAVNAGGNISSPLLLSVISMYFKNKDDAVKYANAKYGGALYDVMIVQFVDRIPRK